VGRKLEIPRLARSVYVQALRPLFVQLSPKLFYSLVSSDEKLALELFKRVLRPGYVVLDVGANIGSYTFTAAKRIGPRGRVYAFEPEPRNCWVLRRLATRFTNVSVVQKAVTSRSGLVPLYLSRWGSSDHRIYDPGDNREALLVESVSIDEFVTLEGLQRVDVIKVDIQGAEVEAIKGMVHTIRTKNLRYLFIEFYPAGLYASGNSSEELLNLLFDLGFTSWRIDEQDRTLHPVDAEDLLKHYTAENGRYTNLFCEREVNECRACPNLRGN
jgi:FkbM family methyltransferase